MKLPVTIIVLAAIVAERVDLGSELNLRLVSLDGKTETWLTESKTNGFGATIPNDGALDLDVLSKNWLDEQLASEGAVLLSVAEHDAMNATLQAKDAEIASLQAQIAAPQTTPEATTTIEPQVEAEPTQEPTTATN